MTELRDQYQVPTSLAQSWITEQQLMLLLDGLDEVEGNQRENCVQALNQFAQTHGQTEMVVCSRTRDYEALSTRLQLRGAICLQPLSCDQVSRYLNEAGLATMRIVLQRESILWEMMRSPLMLNIMVLAYQGKTIEQLPRRDSIEEHSRQLFDAYIAELFNKELVFKRHGSPRQYPEEKTTHWLTWLARMMKNESSTVFLLEKLKPIWLSRRGFVYKATVALCFVLFVLATFILEWSVFWLIEGLAGTYGIEFPDNLIYGPGTMVVVLATIAGFLRPLKLLRHVLRR